MAIIKEFYKIKLLAIIIYFARFTLQERRSCHETRGQLFAIHSVYLLTELITHAKTKTFGLLLAEHGSIYGNITCILFLVYYVGASPNPLSLR